MSSYRDQFSVYECRPQARGKLVGESMSRYGTLQRFVEGPNRAYCCSGVTFAHPFVGLLSDVLINVNVSSEGRCDLD